MGNKRKVTNFLVDSNAQLRLAATYLILFTAAVGLITYLFLSTSTALSSGFDQVTPEQYALLSQAKMNLLFISVAGIAFLGLLCGILWGFASHRIFGPMVQIHQQLDRYLQGVYTEKIKLRKKDEFQGIAEKINQLGESLIGKK